jgi:hypothetical protein
MIPPTPTLSGKVLVSLGPMFGANSRGGRIITSGAQQDAKPVDSTGRNPEFRNWRNI